MKKKTIWKVQFECDSSEFFFSTEKKARAFINECAKNDEVPTEDIDSYFHCWEETLDP